MHFKQALNNAYVQQLCAYIIDSCAVFSATFSPLSTNTNTQRSTLHFGQHSSRGAQMNSALKWNYKCKYSL